MAPIRVDPDLVAIALRIVDAGRTVDQWSEVESDDMLRLGCYEGGFDADERAFVFSRLGEDEQWFQFSLVEARQIASGEKQSVDARPADS